MAESNIHKLLSIDGIILDEIRDTMEMVLEAHHIDTAVGESLDSIGALVDTPRRTGEDDETYRGRIKSAVSALAGSGTISDIEEVVAFVTGLTTADFTVEDGYAVDHDALGNHYGHFRVKINVPTSTSWRAGILAERLEQAKAAGIIIDFAGPFASESISVSESFSATLGLVAFFGESIAFSEEVTIDLDVEVDDAISLSDSSGRPFWVDISYANGLDLVNGGW